MLKYYTNMNNFSYLFNFEDFNHMDTKIYLCMLALAQQNITTMNKGTVIKIVRLLFNLLNQINFVP